MNDIKTMAAIFKNEALFDSLLMNASLTDLTSLHGRCVIGARDVDKVRTNTGHFDEFKMTVCVEIGHKIQDELITRGLTLSAHLTYVFS
jgi:hypothetical protein